MVELKMAEKLPQFPQLQLQQRGNPHAQRANPEDIESVALRHAREKAQAGEPLNSIAQWLLTQNCSKSKISDFLLVQSHAVYDPEYPAKSAQTERRHQKRHGGELSLEEQCAAAGMNVNISSSVISKLLSKALQSLEFINNNNSISEEQQRKYAEVFTLHESGYSYRQIMQIMGIGSTETVGRWLGIAKSAIFEYIDKHDIAYICLLQEQRKAIKKASPIRPVLPRSIQQAREIYETHTGFDTWIPDRFTNKIWVITEEGNIVAKYSFRSLIKISREIIKKYYSDQTNN